MLLYNYSSLHKRETKLYNIGGYNISGGFSVEFLKVVGPVALIGMILSGIIGMLFGISYMNPFSDNFKGIYTFITTALSIGAGCALWYIPIGCYRLYQYLNAYLKPKKVYINDFKASEFKLTNVKIHAFVKNLL